MPPFVRLALMSIAGILLARFHWVRVPATLCVVLSASTVLLAAYWWYVQGRRRAYHDIVLSILFYLLVLLCANSRYNLTNRQPIAMDLYARWEGRPVLWLAEIQETPVRKANYTQAEALLVAYYDTERQTWRLPGRPCTVLLRLQDSLKTLQIADHLLLRSKIEPFAPPLKPGDFDYRAYMHSRNIYLTAWVKQSSCLLVNTSLSGWGLIRRHIAHWQVRLKQSLLQTGVKQHAGVLLALSLGDKSLLRQDIKQLYADTGASHVLAVSGLHVGILFLLMQWLWQPGQRPAWRWLFLLTTLPLLWGYALLTGASPSVLRASLMFSLFSVASCLNRTTNAYNTLALSAFLLLLWNPLLLFHLSFQLSYLAVLGILFFYPRLSKLWQPRFLILKKGYELLCVSVAAQLTTLPLTLLYFRQFPLSSLASSLLVVPPAPFLLLASLGLGIMAWTGAPAAFIALVTKALVVMQSLIERCLQWLQHYCPPVPVPYWDMADTWVAYALLLLLGLYLTKEIAFSKAVIGAAGVLLIGTLHNVSKQYALNKEARLYVWYNSQHKHCEVWIVKGQQAWCSDKAWCARARIWRLTWNGKHIALVNTPVDTAGLWKQPPDVLVWNTYYTIPDRYLKHVPLIVLGRQVSMQQRQALRRRFVVHELSKEGAWCMSENSPVE
ncbi:ComEC/Rec2 family competence protein [Thermonema rossianum]|uniref:ComEC/Rec2 family competence protein n=1 Tax=Thermonema rossianum TaxID=55505 RepID=UPI000A054553|nr:ComEC/Rec2 family competence protein [Thermonema rossianum]